MSVNKILLTFLFLAGLLIGCKKDGSVNPESLKDNDSFVLYEQSFLDALWKINPDWATQEGYHKYDSLLLVPSNKNRDKQLDFDKVQLDSLSRYEVNTLSEPNQIDFYLMQNQLQLFAMADQAG